MELALSLHNGTQVQVACAGRVSHVFALSAIIADENPETLGAALHNALFPAGSPAHAALGLAERLALVLDKDLEFISWESLRDDDGFLALRMPLVRLILPGSRQPVPDLSSTPLQVLAVSSNPVARDVSPLNIAGEWRRLREGVEKLSHQVRLERVNPPTLDSLRGLALTHPQAVIHFMGHGGQAADGAVLFFENGAGGLQPINARDFALSVKKRAFLVTLNACVSAAPGKSEFSNLARLLVEKGLPYALGMSASIPDDAALTFSRALYAELASGVEVEEAVFQARRSLLRDDKRTWLVGVPVLYSSLEAPCTSGFATPTGQPQVNEHLPRLEVFALPRAEGAFQGRIDELLTLGQALTGEPRPKLLTIHGAGGQGKTALAREAAERFAHAWPGGVWAVSLEDFYVLDRFTLELARLFKIDFDGIYKQVASSFPNLETTEYQKHFQQELEHRLLVILNNCRALLVLDNAETFIEAVNAKNTAAIDLAVFLRDKVLSTQTSLLVTSREYLGWPGEQSLELGGLSLEEGARLFWQSTPKRGMDAIGPQAQEISRKVEGHPLSLRLLGSAFDASDISLDEYLHEVEAALLQAEDKYKHEDHRHRTLYASIETSVRYLDEAQKALLSGIWIFQSPFKPEIAAQIFISPDLPESETKAEMEKIYERLYSLSRHGLLMREEEMLADGNLLIYRTLPIVCLFAHHYLEQTVSAEILQTKMGKVYAELLRDIRNQIDRTAWASYLALRCWAELEACLDWQNESECGWYANRLGWVIQHLGGRQTGIRYLESALEMAQDKDKELEGNTLNNLALVYSATGNPGKALELYQQALSIYRELRNREMDATILNNTGEVYSITGHPGQALELYQQALSMHREMGNRAIEAITLNNMALVYSATGDPGKALELYQQALSMHREVGNRAGEAATLNNMAVVYSATGNPGQAFELLEQALSIRHEVGAHPGEATTLNNMGEVYCAIGNLDQAFELYQQALPIHCEVGNRAGEATTLNNMAMVYRATGHPGKALELYQQALPLMREMGSRAGEATMLNNMAIVYNTMGNSDQALELLEQALPIQREVGDRAREATTLTNIAVVYSATSHPGKALELYQQVLPICREVGDRAGEATALNNMASVYIATGQLGQALELYQRALPIRREVGDRAGETATLANIAVLLYNNLAHQQEAIQTLEQAIAILKELGLGQDASGATVSQYQTMLDMMKSDQPLGGEQTYNGLSPEQVQAIASNALAVLTNPPEKRGKWREAIAGLLGEAQAAELSEDAEFFTAIISLLDGKTPVISAENPYAGVVQSILQQVGALASLQGLPNDFIARYTAGLAGGTSEKMSLLDALAGMAQNTSKPGEQVLIETVQKALLGAPLESLGQELPAPEAQIWQEIVRRVGKQSAEE